jgi:hypothetical protein
MSKGRAVCDDMKQDADSRMRVCGVFKNLLSCVDQSQRDNSCAIKTSGAKGCRAASTALSQLTRNTGSQPRGIINTAPFYLVCLADDELLRGPGKIAKNTRLVKVLGGKYRSSIHSKRINVLRSWHSPLCEGVHATKISKLLESPCLLFVCFRHGTFTFDVACST